MLLPVPRMDDRGVTFEWQGTAQQVVVTGTWCDWRADTALQLQRDGETTWSGHLDLPPEAYVEYRLVVDGEPLPDPSNGHRTHNGIDGFNDQLWMPGATRRAIELRSRPRSRGERELPRGEIRHGRVELGWAAVVPKRRRLDLYLPPGAGTRFDPAALPLLVVLDGPDYLERGQLDRTLDGLISTGRMAPVAAAFIANAGASRGVEYGGSDFTIAMLADDVVPAAMERLGVGPQESMDEGPGRAAILGSSMGGLMALHAAIRRPSLFGRAIVQSVPAFTHIDVSTFVLIRHLEPPPVRLWLDAGDYEGLAAANDDLAAVLAERGYDVTYRRQHGGHDQTSWGESLIDALPAMFPPTFPSAASPG
jgi:enterochelin esterase-like enzyme